MLFAVIVIVILIFLLFLISCNYCAYVNVREDKRKAAMGMYRTRTPEDSLKRDAWLGGIGGLVALYIFDHKTATKLDFMESYRRNTCNGLVVQALIIIVLLIVLLLCYFFFHDI